MSTIYLFYWDQFFTEQKLKSRKKEFAIKYGKENIFQLSTKDFNTGETINTIWWSGLFATKKLVILSWLPQDTTSKYNESTKEAMGQFYDYFLANKGSISEDNLIIFHTTTPDKKTKRTKYFLETNDPQIKVTEYKADKKSITGFFQTKFPGWEINAELQEYILQLCNDNMYLVDNETTKIKSFLDKQYADSRKPIVNKDLINNIVSSDANYDVRSFLDGVILGNNPGSIEKLIAFAHEGNNEFQFLWLLYRSLGGIINLIDCRNHNISDAGELAKNAKLPPFTVSRYLSKKNTLQANEQKFKTIYHELLDMDYKLKTWMLPPESFWLSILALFQIDKKSL